jgi:hypothetical protein
MNTYIDDYRKVGQLLSCMYSQVATRPQLCEYAYGTRKRTAHSKELAVPESFVVLEHRPIQFIFGHNIGQSF